MEGEARIAHPLALGFRQQGRALPVTGVLAVRIYRLGMRARNDSAVAFGSRPTAFAYSWMNPRT